MSAIASFYLLNTHTLHELPQHAAITVKKTFFSKKMIDNYWNYLANNATELRSPNCSGYLYLNLFFYLKEQKNIDLMTGKYEELAKELTDKRGSSHLLFTIEHRETFLHSLVPDQYSLTDLQKYNQAFSDEGDEETALLTVEALQVLQENLHKVQHQDQVLLLIIG